MKKIQLILLASITLMACNKGNVKLTDLASDNNGATKVSQLSNNSKAATAPCWIVATNDASAKVEVYDPVVYDWNTSAALKHSWYPNASNGFTNPTNGWGNPSDARLRQIGSTQYLCVAASSGFCAIIPYPSLTGKLWAINIGSSANPHACELLPNGNVAIAGSNGNWVRVYTASQGTYSSNYAQFNLNASHAALWDPLLNRLWVTGQDPSSSAQILTALIIGGTNAAPNLTEDIVHRSTLPTSWGHDVQPYYGNTNQLLVSTNGGAYIYDKTAKTFTGAPNGANRTFVKSISIQPGTSQLVETVPSASDCANGWSTPQVDFFTPNATRTVTSACFYKARVFCPEYQ